MFGEFDMFAPIREKWEQFKAWWNSNITPVWNSFVSDFKAAFGELDFSGLTGGLSDAWNTVSDAVSTAWDAISPVVDRIAQLRLLTNHEYSCHSLR